MWQPEAATLCSVCQIGVVEASTPHPVLGTVNRGSRGDHSHGGKMVAANSGSEKYIAGSEGEKERMRDSERLPPTVMFVKGGEMSTRNMDLDFHSRSQRKPW